jgi:two-component system response regulator TtrR
LADPTAPRDPPREFAPEPTVFVIDDDESIRELLAWLMARNAIACETFANARSFLAACQPDAPGCLVLDLYMPGMSGLDLQKYLTDHGIVMPVIFLSGRADVSNAVRAVKGGAIDFIEKPFDYRRIVALVKEGLARDATMRAERRRSRELGSRLGTLTQREHEVLGLVVAGKLSRVIAEELAISIKTVEAHRSKIMEKLGVGSIAELVHAIVAVKTPPNQQDAIAVAPKPGEGEAQG